MDRKRSLPLACLLIPLLACVEPPSVDLAGPRVERASLEGPRSVEVSVTPALILEFGEALDPASIHGGSVVVVAWDELESCALASSCAEGSCERGTCQASPLSAAQRNAIDRGEFEGGEALSYALDEAGTRLTIRPRRPLAPHRRHSLIVGTAVRDRSGAPLVDRHGQVAAWQRDFVTAGRGSGGPEPGLVAPAPGQIGVPTNLATIDTRLWPPVPSPDADAILVLESEAGETIALGDPSACPGWAPGTCLRWRPIDPLAPGERYRIAGGTFHDRHGRAALLPAVVHETWFGVGPGPDLEPPQAAVVAQMRGRCLAVWVEVGEAVEARLIVGELEQRLALVDAGWIGLAIEAPLAPEDLVAWTLELRDLADNHAEVSGETPAGPSFTAQLPRVALTEILANPDGPEPDAEFLEIQAGPQGAALEGVHVADASLAEIRAAWLAGEILGDPLPAIELEADELALIVGERYGLEPGEDPQPPPETRLILVDASLGAGGLKNAGERVTLWAETAQGPAVVSSYGDWIETGASTHEGRSVVAGADGCDLPDRWRSHPFGRSTPGTLP